MTYFAVVGLDDECFFFSFYLKPLTLISFQVRVSRNPENFSGPKNHSQNSDPLILKPGLYVAMGIKI